MIERYLTAVGAHDWETVRQCFVPGAVRRLRVRRRAHDRGPARAGAARHPAVRRVDPARVELLGGRPGRHGVVRVLGAHGPSGAGGVRGANTTLGRALHRRMVVRRRRHVADHQSQPRHRLARLARPRAGTIGQAITSMPMSGEPGWSDPLHGASAPGVHWTRANIDEIFPSAITHLTWSFVGDAGELGWRASFYDAGILPRVAARAAARPERPSVERVLRASRLQLRIPEVLRIRRVLEHRRGCGSSPR